jgi:hypothetical protein
MIHAQVSPFHCGTNRVTGWPLMGSRSCARSKTARPIHFTAGSSGAILRVTVLSRYVSADPGTGRPRPRDQSCPPSLASISRGSMWPSTPRIPQLTKVVAICDHLAFLFRAKRKDEVTRKATAVPLYLFVQTFCRDTVHLSKVGVDDDPFAPDQEDPLFDPADLDNLIARLHSVRPHREAVSSNPNDLALSCGRSWRGGGESQRRDKGDPSA